MQNKKAQLEFAIMKGLLLALVVLGGFYIYEKISGLTDKGEPIVCEWNCENVRWSNCVDGYQYREVGKCTCQDDCKCIPNDSRCFNSNAKPSTQKNC